MYYVYAFLDPNKPGKFQYSEFSLLFEPFYIGKGIRYRDTSHLLFCWMHHTPFYSKLYKMIANDVLPYIVRLSYHDDETTAYSIEHYCIKNIGTRFDKTHSGPLLNLTLGGSGGISPSKIVRDKISKSRKGKGCGKNNINYGKDWMKGEGNPYYGKKHSTEIRQKMKRTYLIWRDGEFTIINDLSMFCKEYGYSLQNATTAANGKHLYRDIKIIKMLDDDIDKYKEALKKV